MAFKTLNSFRFEFIILCLRYAFTGAKGDITTQDLDAFLAAHDEGSLKARNAARNDL